MTTTIDQDTRLWILGLRDGWLYLRSPTQLLRLSPWPAVDLEIRTATGAWAPVSDELATALLPRVEAKHPQFTYEGWDRWRDGDGQVSAGYALDYYERSGAWNNALLWRYLHRTPLVAVRGATKPAHWQFPPLGLAYLLARVPEVADFLAHDPNLALLLANHRRDWPTLREASWEEIRARVRGRRTDVLGWLGLPAREAMRGLLRKLSPSGLEYLPAAAPALGDQRILLTLLTSREGITPQLALLGCAPLRRLVPPEVFQRLQRNVWFWTQLGAQYRVLLTLAERGVFCFRSSGDLVSFVEGGRSAMRTATDTVVDVPFPEPPFITGPEVEPIRSIHSLIREGHEMDHCVGSPGYIAAVLAGYVYFYSVLSPVRATLELCWRRGSWRFETLLGYCNASIPRREMLEALHAFPASHWIAPYAEVDFCERYFAAEGPTY